MATAKKAVMSPSRIARYFFHDCDTFLLFHSTLPDDRVEHGIPEGKNESQPLMEAIQHQGNRWEESAVTEYLAGQRVHVADGDCALADRFHDVDATLALLRNAAVGDWIYQPTLEVPGLLYEQFGLTDERITFSKCRPDLLAIVEDPKTGGRLLRVIDLKRGERLKAHYAIQISVYALILKHVIGSHGIDNLRVDLDLGAIWLGHHEEPTLCDISAMMPHITQFLRHTLPELISRPMTDLGWHRYFRCEWCEFYEHCTSRMEREQDISMLAGLNPRARRHLTEAFAVNTLTELETLLARDDADSLFDTHPLTRGKSHRMRAQVRALLMNEPVAFGASSVVLPKKTSREISIMLTVQPEPASKTSWMWGFDFSAGSRVPASLLPGDDVPCVFAASAPEQVEEVRLRFVLGLHALLVTIDAYNAKQTEWAKQINLQLYVYSKREQELLIQGLIEALDDPMCRDEAMRLLLYLHSSKSLVLDDQAEILATAPLVTLLETMQQLIALPVATSYQLSGVLEAFGDSSYPHDDKWHYPLGHGLRADVVYGVWTADVDEEKSQASELVAQGEALLGASLRAVAYVRNLVEDELVVYAPKFRLPQASGIDDPILRKLAFFAQYEASLNARQARTSRMAPLSVQRQLDQVIEVECIDQKNFVVLTSNIELTAHSFTSYLMVSNTPRGRIAQLSFDDAYYQSTYPWQLPKHSERAIVSIKSVVPDELGFSQQVELSAYKSFKGSDFEAGERYLLYKRHSDSNTTKIVTFLRELDQRPIGLYRQLLHDPLVAARRAPLPDEIERIAARDATSLDLTPSKLAAYETMRNQQVTALWGPPGTGKTHFLAATILALSKAHAEVGKSFRVLVTAFTHAAIENVLVKIDELRKDLSQLEHELTSYKGKEWKGLAKPDTIEVAKKKKLAATLTKKSHAVLGATIYATMELDDDDFEGFDLVVMDEASQVQVPLASVPSRLVKNKGRLIFAGDHLQLAPIITGTYPDPEQGQPLLHRSIFEMLLDLAGEQSHVVATLLENFRMNDVLTSYAARLLYPPEYSCFGPKSANRRLPIADNDLMTIDDELVRALICPQNPITLVLLDSPSASRESPLEAELTAKIVCTLREKLSANSQKQLYEDDAAFFTRGCFIVSPHHSQIRLIRRALHDARAWTSAPFVDTVDKMQGQEADCVIVSYGVGHADAAAMEAKFIYDRNRLNVAITRARSKTIVMLSRALIEATPQVIEDPEVAQGLGYMRGLLSLLEEHGASTTHQIEYQGQPWTLEVLSASRPVDVPGRPNNEEHDSDREGAGTLAKAKSKKQTKEAAIGFEAELWQMADKMRGQMDSSEYKHYVLGLIFLKYISDAFDTRRKTIEAELTDPDHEFFLDPTEYDTDEEYRDDLDYELEERDNYTAANVFWVPKDARWSAVVAVAKTEKVGVFIDKAMKAIEEANPATLKDVLPKIYGMPKMEARTLGQLVDMVTNIYLGGEASKSRDILGRVYEYFLGQFADAEGKRGGQFYTPRSVVRTLVELIEPLEGRIYDPCCGSGGMFVQSVKFLESHGGKLSDVSIFGQESNPTTWRLSRMNLAIRGISADLGEKHADTFHNDLHRSEKFDYVLANPPFNISDWSGELLEDDTRWKGYGSPSSSNANFAWILHIVHHLTETGVAAIVMANGSMSSMSNGEGDIRQQLVENNLVDCMVALPNQLFYNTQIPVCIWVLAKHRNGTDKLRDRSGEVLFIDARNMGHMETRTHKAFTNEDIEKIGETYHNWRSKDGSYEDVAGFCNAASMKDIEQHNFVLIPGRYVGAEELDDDGELFKEKASRLINQMLDQIEESKRLEQSLVNLLKEVGL